MDYESLVMQLIVNAGNSRSKSMEAINLARSGRFHEAEKLLKSAEEDLSHAHEGQTELIQEEAGGSPVRVSLLLVHAQDHLMNAALLKDMAQEFIHLYERIQAK